MKHHSSEKGQALILIALAVIGLVGFSALTIDGGRVLSDKRNAQNAADTSVLSAALAKIQGKSDYKNYGVTRATSNGYSTGSNATVEINLCNELGLLAKGYLRAPTHRNIFASRSHPSFLRPLHGYLVGIKSQTQWRQLPASREAHPRVHYLAVLE